MFVVNKNLITAEQIKIISRKIDKGIKWQEPVEFMNRVTNLRPVWVQPEIYLSFVFDFDSFCSVQYESQKLTSRSEIQHIQASLSLVYEVEC